MLVKAALGDGHWSIWEAEGEVTFLGHHCFVSVPDGDHDYWKDDRFPTPGDGVIHVLNPVARHKAESGDPRPAEHLMHWVRWVGDGQEHVLITDGSVFLCNNQGDTIETLRGSGGNS